MRRNKSSRLRFEALEDRLPMAGNVSVRTLGPALIITGNSDDNSISIAPGSTAGQMEIAGLAGTTINGGSGPFTFNGPVRTATIQLRGGDDSVTISNATFAGSLIITDLQGANTISVTDSYVTGNFGVYTGNDVDNVLVQGTTLRIGGQIVAGGGNDVVEVAQTTATIAPLVIDTGLRLHRHSSDNTPTDDDSVTIRGGQLNRLVLTTGRGDDQVDLINADIVTGLVLSTGGGDDTVSFSGSHVGRRTQLVLGSGADQVDISASTFDSALLALMGGDDDTLTITNTTVQGNARLRGGGGTDTFVDGGGNAFNGGFSEDFEV